MKIWKLVSGIFSIVFFVFIKEQVRFVSVVNAWENNRNDTSDVAGVVVAFLILIAGLFSAIMYKSTHKGGFVLLSILYGLAALFGYSHLGTFGDLVVWSSYDSASRYFSRNRRLCICPLLFSKGSYST